MITPTTSWYRAALARPHQAYARTEVWRGARMLDEVDLLDGSVRASLSSRVTRTLSASVLDSLYPVGPTDLLSPYGHHLRVYRGIRYGDGTVDEFPIFRGPIRSVAPDGSGRARLTAVDLAGEVAAVGLRNPVPSQIGNEVVAEFERLVLDALPEAEFGAHSDLWQKVPELAYEFDRGQALDALAQTASSYWYALAGGQFVIRRVPWTVGGTPRLALSDGPDGILVRAYPNRDSENIHNVITVVSERADGGAPITWTAEDDDPASVTYVGGPFGEKSRQVRVQGANTSSQVRDTAQTILRTAKARTESWRATMIPDPSLELGDVVTLNYGSRVGVVQVIAGFDIPILPTGAMSIDTRAQVVGGVA